MPEVLFCVKPIKLDLASFKVPKRLQALPRLLRVTLWSWSLSPPLLMGPFEPVCSLEESLENAGLKKAGTGAPQSLSLGHAMLNVSDSPSRQFCSP